MESQEVTIMQYTVHYAIYLYYLCIHYLHIPLRHYYILYIHTYIYYLYHDMYYLFTLSTFSRHLITSLARLRKTPVPGDLPLKSIHFYALYYT